MTVNAANKSILWSFGFTNQEIDVFNRALTPDGKQFQPEIDLHSEAWTSAILERQELVRQIRETYEREQNRPLTRQRRDNIIRNFYADKSASPWDFIKQSYKPMPKSGTITPESITRARQESQKRINKWKRTVIR